MLLLFLCERQIIQGDAFTNDSLLDKENDDGNDMQKQQSFPSQNDRHFGFDMAKVVAAGLEGVDLSVQVRFYKNNVFSNKIIRLTVRGLNF